MLLRTIYDHASCIPEKLALVNGEERLTYRRFAQLIDYFYHFLIELNLPPDGVVAEISANITHRWIMLIALRALGRTVVSAPSWAVLESLELAELSTILCLDDDATTKEAVVASGSTCRIVGIPREAFSDAPLDHPLTASVDQRFGDHIAYSSGTTGCYKKVVMREEGIRQFVDQDIRGVAAGLYSRDMVNHASNFGPWTIAGHRMPLCVWYLGATIIFEQRTGGVKHFFDHPVNYAIVLPPMLAQLAARFPEGRPGSAPLRIIAGGGFTNPDVALDAVKRLNCELYVQYGGTEFMVAFERRVRTAEDVIWLDPTSPGEIQIVDEDDRPVAIGEEGIIRVRLLPSNPQGYLDDPEATARHFRDGWFYPGDMAVQRGDGRVRILGRVANVLNIGAQKIAVEPIEERARQLLEVENVCMFAGQTDSGQVEVLIVIEGDRFPDKARLDLAAAQSSQHFSHVRFALLPKFPRGENGMMKIDRRAVRRLAG
jgi:acyl-coenzyme A synthetase/AMP-(fatty) acid ligase